MTYPQEVDFLTGKSSKPLPPIVLEPMPGQEVTNLDPVLTVKWNKGIDQWYMHNRELLGSYNAENVHNNSNNISSKSTLDSYVSNSVMAGVLSLQPGKEIGFYDKIGALSTPHLSGYGWSAGRIKRIWLKLDSNITLGQDVQFKVYTGTQVTKEWNIIINNPGTHAYSGYLQQDGMYAYIEFPYDDMFLRDQPFMITFLTNRTDVKLRRMQYYNYFYTSYDYPELNVNASEVEYDTATGVWKGMAIQQQNQGINDYIVLAMYELYEGHYLDLAYDIEINTGTGDWQHLATNYYGEQTTAQFDLSDIVDVTETSQAKIRMRVSDKNSEHDAPWDHSWNDNYSDWVESGNFYIFKHVAPLKPINLKASDTGVIDRSLENRLSWRHIQNSINNRQGRATVRWRLQGNQAWNTVEKPGMGQFWDVPSNTFPLGTIEWQVTTYNSVDMAGPYSDIVTFVAKDTPSAPILTAPLSIVEDPLPIVAWEHSYIQTHYQIEVLTVLDNVIWTSGEVESTITSTRLEKYLDNLATFKVKARVKNNEGLWSAWTTEKSFNTDYKFPAPAQVTSVSGSGYITISYTNPYPTGNQPFIARNEIYKKIDNEWVKISDSSPGTFNDYAAANGITHEYFVRSVAPNEVYTDSEIVTGVVSVRGIVLHLVNDPASTMYQFKLDGHGRSKNWGIESSIMRFKGRKYPVIEVGTMQDDTIEFTLMLDDADKQALDRIVYSGQICCYRDGRGRLSHGIFTEYPVTDERWGGYSVTLSLTKIDYVENV